MINNINMVNLQNFDLMRTLSNSIFVESANDASFNQDLKLRYLE
ncbi:hypothetical protein NMY3_02074 [Candidatus Nitrosocosmicus oleophilus]|jgi:hypothetical protein|uniref:Uncharacterized protein n=1 Tax=Candidatus Nitrosocosmicus oleophilus TaxID=1353260 RepID=A0A654LYF7_9ARCH|nr:hypothetical protein NMY3_02074 [Candidatus Nitrosocosmicus oleophilus]